MNQSAAARTLDETVEFDDVPRAVPIGLVEESGVCADGSQDGRTQRRTRNRDRVIVSMVELIREGNSDPSVAEIADAAGVSHRSVFRYFIDLNDLLRAAVDYEVQQALPLGTIPNPGQGPLGQRVDELVDARLRIFAYSLLTGRVAHSRADAIPSVEQALLMIHQVMRTQARTQFQPELTAVDLDVAEFTLDALTMLLSFRSYDIQRRIGHSPERIRLVWKQAVLAMLRA